MRSGRIAIAKERLASGDLIPVKDGYQGAARKKVKSIEEEIRANTEQRAKDDQAASKNN